MKINRMPACDRVIPMMLEHSDPALRALLVQQRRFLFLGPARHCVLAGRRNGMAFNTWCELWPLADGFLNDL